jgi:hypothetical protein
LLRALLGFLAAGGKVRCATEHDLRTLDHENEQLVKSIYHFFREECAKVAFNLSDWYFLIREQIMDDEGR